MERERLAVSFGYCSFWVALFLKRTNNCRYFTCLVDILNSVKRLSLKSEHEEFTSIVLVPSSRLKLTKSRQDLKLLTDIRGALRALNVI